MQNSLTAEVIGDFRECLLAFFAAVTACVEANVAYDAARNRAIGEETVELRLPIDPFEPGFDVVSPLQAVNAAREAMSAARTNLVNLYEAHFGSEGVRVLELFLSALQTYSGTNHDQVVFARGLTVNELGTEEAVHQYMRRRDNLLTLTPVPELI